MHIAERDAGVAFHHRDRESNRRIHRSGHVGYRPQEGGTVGLEGVSAATAASSDGWLEPSSAVRVTLELSLAVTVTAAVSPAVAPVPSFNNTNPYWVSATMLTESMIGGLTGLARLAVAVVLDGDAGDGLADVVARHQFADDHVLIVE